MKALILTIAILFADLSAGHFPGATGQVTQKGDGPGTCEEAVAELARFKNVSSEWGTTMEGAPFRSARHSSADGEWFAGGFTIYKSKSQFNKSVRRIVDDLEGVIERTPLFDARGRRSGQRVVKETRDGGHVIRVDIWVMTDRMIRGINAPSLKLALAVEKATITCPAEETRRLTNR